MSQGKTFMGMMPTPTPKRLAFVYPGLGNQFAGMGRALSVLWPDVLDGQDLENGYLQATV